MDLNNKTTFLIKFLKFVHWPEEVIRDPNTPVVIGIFGDDSIAAEMEKQVVDLTIHSRPVRLIQSYEIAKLLDANLIFIADSEKSHIPSLLEFLDKYPVLTVGESEEFIHQGGMIGFIDDGKTVRFGVNLTAARNANLKISSKLLKLASMVKQDTP